MGVEITATHGSYQDIQFMSIDCPRSIEFSQETYNALIGVDMAIVPPAVVT